MPLFGRKAKVEAKLPTPAWQSCTYLVTSVDEVPHIQTSLATLFTEQFINKSAADIEAGIKTTLGDAAQRGELIFNGERFKLRNATGNLSGTTDDLSHDQDKKDLYLALNELTTDERLQHYIAQGCNQNNFGTVGREQVVKKLFESRIAGLKVTGAKYEFTRQKDDSITYKYSGNITKLQIFAKEKTIGGQPDSLLGKIETITTIKVNADGTIEHTFNSNKVSVYDPELDAVLIEHGVVQNALKREIVSRKNLEEITKKTQDFCLEKKLVERNNIKQFVAHASFNPDNSNNDQLIASVITQISSLDFSQFMEETDALIEKIDLLIPRFFDNCYSPELYVIGYTSDFMDKWFAGKPESELWPKTVTVKDFKAPSSLGDVEELLAEDAELWEKIKSILLHPPFAESASAEQKKEQEEQLARKHEEFAAMLSTDERKAAVIIAYNYLCKTSVQGLSSEDNSKFEILRKIFDKAIENILVVPIIKERKENYTFKDILRGAYIFDKLNNGILSGGSRGPGEAKATVECFSDEQIQKGATADLQQLLRGLFDCRANLQNILSEQAELPDLQRESPREKHELLVSRIAGVLTALDTLKNSLAQIQNQSCLDGLWSYTYFADATDSVGKLPYPNLATFTDRLKGAVAGFHGDSNNSIAHRESLEATMATIEDISRSKTTFNDKLFEPVAGTHQTPTATKAKEGEKSNFDQNKEKLDEALVFLTPEKLLRDYITIQCNQGGFFSADEEEITTELQKANIFVDGRGKHEFVSQSDGSIIYRHTFDIKKITQRSAAEVATVSIGEKVTDVVAEPQVVEGNENIPLARIVTTTIIKVNSGRIEHTPKSRQTTAYHPMVAAALEMPALAGENLEHIAPFASCLSSGSLPNLTALSSPNADAKSVVDTENRFFRWIKHNSFKVTLLVVGLVVAGVMAGLTFGIPVVALAVAGLIHVVAPFIGSAIAANVVVSLVAGLATGLIAGAIVKYETIISAIKNNPFKATLGIVTAAVTIVGIVLIATGVFAPLGLLVSALPTGAALLWANIGIFAGIGFLAGLITGAAVKAKTIISAIATAGKAFGEWLGLVEHSEINPPTVKQQRVQLAIPPEAPINVEPPIRERGDLFEDAFGENAFSDDFFIENATEVNGLPPPFVPVVFDPVPGPAPVIGPAPTEDPNSSLGDRNGDDSLPPVSSRLLPTDVRSGPPDVTMSKKKECKCSFGIFSAFYQAGNSKAPPQKLTSDFEGLPDEAAAAPRSRGIPR